MAVSIRPASGGKMLDISASLWREQDEMLEVAGRLYAAWANDGVDHFEWHGDNLIWFLKSGEAIST